MLYTTPDSFEHTVVNPLMTGAGLALIETLNKDVVVLHVVAVVVSCTCTVPAPAAPQSTVMLFVPAPEAIVPPATDQLYVLPTTLGVLYATPNWFAHTEFNPLINGVGDITLVTVPTTFPTTKPTISAVPPVLVMFTV